MDDKRVRAALYLAGVLASAIIVGGGALDETSPAQIFLSLILVVLAISFVTLVIPALIRIGDNRPPAVQFVARSSDLSAGWYPDQQNPAWIHWQDGTQRTRHVRLETTPTELLIQTRCISAMKRTLITLIAVACLTASSGGTDGTPVAVSSLPTAPTTAAGTTVEQRPLPPRAKFTSDDDVEPASELCRPRW